VPVGQRGRGRDAAAEPLRGPAAAGACALALARARVRFYVRARSRCNATAALRGCRRHTLRQDWVTSHLFIHYILLISNKYESLNSEQISYEKCYYYIYSNTHRFRGFELTFAYWLKFSLIDKLTYEIDV
jgi:hypothetical protein